MKTLHLSESKRIYTDGLKQYKTLMDPSIHKVTQYGTNHIKRNNLIIRHTLNVCQKGQYISAGA